MEISSVSNVEVRDLAGIVDHTYSRLDASERGRLTLQSNFPGSVDISVAGVDVRITT